ncbi:hypothetical protein BH24ACT26_BH24ACT26_22980 [soil metagenome]
MDDRELARWLSYARLGIGAGLVLMPRLATKVWTGEVATPGMRLGARSVGARDMALAVGTLNALSDGGSPGPWLQAGAVADAGDALGALSAFGSLPSGRRLPLLASSLGAIALGVRLAGRLR